MIKVEIGALKAEEIGKVVVKLKTAGYQVGLFAEDVWAFALKAHRRASVCPANISPRGSCAVRLRSANLQRG